MAWLRHDLIRESLRDLESPDTALLEVGCGMGAMGARLAQRFDYLGVESDEASAAVAAERLAAVGSGRVVNAGFDTIDGSRRFDVVCAFEVLEHLEDDLAALRRWHSLLRPGGRLVISVPAYESQFGAVDELVGHYRRYDPEALARLMAGAGFDRVTLRVYGWPIGYLTRAVHNVVARRRGLDEGIEERTAGSGRLLQPDSRWQGAATSALTAPFRLLQRIVPGRARGTGIVASARAGG
jgi:SAM-dependent methyltransferase